MHIFNKSPSANICSYTIYLKANHSWTLQCAVNILFHHACMKYGKWSTVNP